MTLSQLSVQYDASAALVAGRLAQLRLALRTTGDQEEARRLRRRIAELRPMLEQCREIVHKFNAVYGEYFTGKPARSCVAVKTLPKDVLCEVEVIAVL